MPLGGCRDPSHRGRDPERAAALGAQRVADIAREAIAARGRSPLRSQAERVPRPLYNALVSRTGIEWRRWEVFLGDERAVSTEDERSNYHHADAILLSRVSIQAERLHPMFALGKDLDEAAADYERTLVSLLGDPPVFDLILLGIGSNGHTLSLFPGSSAIDETRRYVVALHDPPMDPPLGRITFTPPVVWAARHVLVVATGTSKAGPVADAMEGPEARERTPAQIVRDARGEVTFLLDTASAARLKAPA